MSDSNPNDLAKIVERDNVITYKRKPQPKNPYRSATDDEDLDSASSYKTSNQPLPELQKDRRKLLIKPFGSLQPKNNNNNTGFVEKEVRQHDNILLKQRNNLLANENIKLKTKITVLEKQNEKLQKTIESQQSQTKPITAFSNNREKVRTADSTLRVIIRGLRKQIEDFKKENVSIKSTVKFTSLKQLQVQRDNLAQQTIRLRLALEEQLARRTTMKANSHGVSALEHRLHTVSQRNSTLNKQFAELTEKYKKLQESSAKSNKASQNERNIAKALNNARKVISEKENQIQILKNQIRSTGNISVNSLPNQTKENKFELKRVSIQKKTKSLIPTNYNKVQNNSAQKIGWGKDNLCKKCPRIQAQMKSLQDKCKKLQAQMNKAPLGSLSKNPIQKVTQTQVAELKRFLILRFKAHRLTHEDSQRYLLNCEGELSKEELTKEMAVRELMQSLFVQPFCVASNRYLQIFISKLAYGDISQKIKIDDEKKVNKKTILQAYLKLLPKYDIMTQEKEEEMFIQVAELITTYYQQILAALTAKRNGEGTISQQHFLEFFKQIELEQEYIDFIITQIILESIDMDHLNFYAMFEIFYMPQITSAANSNPQSMKKKKFEVSHENVVHEQDEEYEQSKSHLGRNKTLQQKDEDQKQKQQNYDWQQEQTPKQAQSRHLKKQEGQQFYAEEYQQQKMHDDPNNESNVKEYIIAEDEFS